MSMTNEAERYNFILKKSGLSKKDFADSLGLSLSMNYQISTGRIKLPRDQYERLAVKYGVNLHWFLTGDGSSGIGEETAQIQLYDQEAAAGFGREIDEFPELII